MRKKSQARALDKIFTKIIGYNSGEKPVSYKSTAKIINIKNSLADSSKNPVFPFNRSETFKTGKQRIKKRTEKKETEDIKKAQEILSIFNSPAGKDDRFLDPSVLENDVVFSIFKKNRRKFGSPSNPVLTSQTSSVHQIRFLKNSTDFSHSKPLLSKLKKSPISFPVSSLHSPTLSDFSIKASNKNLQRKRKPYNLSVHRFSIHKLNFLP